jgi:hypothetical protein
MGDNNHISPFNLDELHQEPKGGGKKGCLTRHQGRQENNHCSHQWQAYVKAEEQFKLYNWRAYESLLNQRFDSGSRETKKGKKRQEKAGYVFDVERDVFPPGHALEQNGPKKAKDWDIGKFKNFKHYLTPWWQNAHHIVPNRTLSQAIDEACADTPKPGELVNVIKACLLKAEYNLNDKENMIILPMGRVVAGALKLPRHLRNHESNDGQDNYWNHPDYNINVKSQLKKNMNEIKSKVMEAWNKAQNKDHPPIADPKLTKDKIVAISQDIRKQIVAAGKMLDAKGEAGISLDEAFPAPPEP